MARIRSEAETTVIPILRDDGTVYFHYEVRTIGERLCQWTLAFLWFLVAGVTVAALI
jgi:hypothetical protein